MEIDRPSSPEALPENLWSSILDSVSSSRSIPAKQILLLGQPSTGKSTLAAALMQKQVADEEKDEQQRTDFALGYDFADVRDEGDEGTLAVCCVDLGEADERPKIRSPGCRFTLCRRLHLRMRRYSLIFSRPGMCCSQLSSSSFWTGRDHGLFWRSCIPG